MPKVVNYTEGKGGNFFTAPVGSHPAIIVWVAELWTAMSNYGKDDREQDLLRIFFEIEADVDVAQDWEDEKIEARVFVVEQNYTCVISSKSNLGKMISGVYGRQPKEIKGFALDHLLGRKCVINVTHNDSGYAKIDSVSTETKKMKYHEQEKESFYFGLNEEEFDLEKFEGFAPFVKERIEISKEYKSLYGVTDEDDDFIASEKVAEKNTSDQELSTADAEAVFDTPKEEVKKEAPKKAPAKAEAKTEEANPFGE